MFEPLISWALKILSKMLPFIFRWIYPSTKMLELVEVTIGSENTGLEVNCGELPQARVWLEITNLSPFELNLIGTEAILYWVSRAGEFSSMQRMAIKPHSKARLHLEASLNESQATHIKNNHSMNKPRLYVSMYFESSVRIINKVRDIETSNISLLNCKII